MEVTKGGVKRKHDFGDFNAATVGILDSGISCSSSPSATSNFLEMVMCDPTDREKALVEAYKKATGKNIYDVIQQAFRRAQGISPEQSDEEDVHPIYKEPPIMVLVNFDIPQDNDKLITERLVEETETHSINRDPTFGSILNLGYHPCAYDCSFGIVHAFRRDCGEFFEIMLYKGVILNQPGLVAAVGGIPNELKVKDGLSFSYPCPTYKIAKIRTQDFPERYKAHLDAFDELIEKEAFTRTLQQAYNAARGYSSILDLPEEVEKRKAHDEGQESRTMIEVNVDISGVITFASSREDVFSGYSLRIVKDHYGGTIKLLQRDCGDHFEILHYKGVLSTKPGLATIAAGGVPDELKVAGGISVWYPCPAMRIRKDMCFDKAEHEKAVKDAYKEVLGNAATIKAVKQALNNSRCSSTSKQSEKMEQQSLAMIEVNFVARRVT